MNKTKATPGQQLLNPGQLSLPERAAEIDRRHGRVVKTMRCAVLRWMALGHELIAAKKQVREEVGPRNWLNWLEENTDVSERTAQMAMNFAKNERELRERLEQENRNVADLSIRPAARIIRLERFTKYRTSKTLPRLPMGRLCKLRIGGIHKKGPALGKPRPVGGVPHWRSPQSSQAW